MLDHKEGWVPKNWCFRTLVLEKTCESPLDRREVRPVNPKGNRFWIFIGRTDHKAEAPILWPPDAKSWLIGKDPDAGKDSGQEEKGMIEDEVVGWHHWLNGHEFEQTLGDGEGQGNLACCGPWGHRVGHDWATEQQDETPESWELADSLSASLSLSFCHVTTQGGCLCLQLRKSVSEEPDHAVTLILNFQPKNYEKIHLLLLKPPGLWYFVLETWAN